jgi:hypothetical protein
MKIYGSIFLLLKVIISVPCGSYLPKDTMSCTSSNTPDNYCCLLSAYVNSVMVTSCYPIEKTKYHAIEDEMVLNDIVYSVDCGTEMGTNCGSIYDPVSYKDCGKFSMATSACCYWEFKGDTGCVWQGANQAGIVEYNGLKIICSGGFIGLNVIYLLIALFMFLF